MSHSPLSVVVAVSGNSQRAHLLDALMVDDYDYDVIFVESIAHGYSRIKQVTPDLVVVFLEIDDLAACQLLSMLKMDHDLSGIPVVACATGRMDRECEDIVAELVGESSCLTHAVQMN